MGVAIHGFRRPGQTSRFYSIWHGAKDRCFNKNARQYQNYGCRGITMYGPWIINPVAFIKYVQSLPGSDNPKLSLDRIDTNGNYEPNNLRWATQLEQVRNRRDNISVDLIKQIKYLLQCSCLSLRAIAKRLNTSVSTVIRVKDEKYEYRITT